MVILVTITRIVIIKIAILLIDQVDLQWKAFLPCKLINQDGDGDISFNEFVWLMTR